MVENRYFKIQDFSGGMNLVLPSSQVPLNQCLLSVNFYPKGTSLVKRKGSLLAHSFDVTKTFSIYSEGYETQYVNNCISPVSVVKFNGDFYAASSAGLIPGKDKPSLEYRLRGIGIWKLVNYSMGESHWEPFYVYDPYLAGCMERGGRDFNFLQSVPPTWDMSENDGKLWVTNGTFNPIMINKKGEIESWGLPKPMQAPKAIISPGYYNVEDTNLTEDENEELARVSSWGGDCFCFDAIRWKFQKKAHNSERSHNIAKHYFTRLSGTGKNGTYSYKYQNSTTNNDGPVSEKSNDIESYGSAIDLYDIGPKKPAKFVCNAFASKEFKLRYPLDHEYPIELMNNQTNLSNQDVVVYNYPHHLPVTDRRFLGRINSGDYYIYEGGSAENIREQSTDLIHVCKDYYDNFYEGMKITIWNHNYMIPDPTDPDPQSDTLKPYTYIFNSGSSDFEIINKFIDALGRYTIQIDRNATIKVSYNPSIEAVSYYQSGYATGIDASTDGSEFAFNRIAHIGAEVRFQSIRGENYLSNITARGDKIPATSRDDFTSEPFPSSDRIHFNHYGSGNFTGIYYFYSSNVTMYLVLSISSDLPYAYGGDAEATLTFIDSVDSRKYPITYANVSVSYYPGHTTVSQVVKAVHDILDPYGMEFFVMSGTRDSDNVLGIGSKTWNNFLFYPEINALTTTDYVSFEIGSIITDAIGLNYDVTDEDLYGYEFSHRYDIHRFDLVGNQYKEACDIFPGYYSHVNGDDFEEVFLPGIFLCPMSKKVYMCFVDSNLGYEEIPYGNAFLYSPVPTKITDMDLSYHEGGNEELLLGQTSSLVGRNNFSTTDYQLIGKTELYDEDGSAVPIFEDNVHHDETNGIIDINQDPPSPYKYHIFDKFGRPWFWGNDSELEVVQWNNNPFEWDVTNSNKFNHEVTCVVKAPDTTVAVNQTIHVFIFTTNGIYASGGALDQTQIFQIDPTKGCASRNSAISDGKNIYFINRDGIFVIDGLEVVKISESIDPWFHGPLAFQYETIRTARISKNESLNQLYVSLNSFSNSSAENVSYDMALVFDITTKSWHIDSREFSDTVKGAYDLLFNDNDGNTYGVSNILSLLEEDGLFYQTNSGGLHLLNVSFEDSKLWAGHNFYKYNVGIGTKNYVHETASFVDPDPGENGNHIKVSTSSFSARIILGNYYMSTYVTPDIDLGESNVRKNWNRALFNGIVSNSGFKFYSARDGMNIYEMETVVKLSDLMKRSATLLSSNPSDAAMFSRFRMDRSLVGGYSPESKQSQQIVLPSGKNLRMKIESIPSSISPTTIDGVTGTTGTNLEIHSVEVEFSVTETKRG